MITLNHPMIKELSLAVIFGLLIGFGLTGTFYYIRQSSHQPKNTPNFVIPTLSPDSPANPKISPTPTSSSNLNLEITSPQNNDIIATSKTIIKGNTAPNSLIVITTLLKNYHLTADIQGLFSQSIDLEPGLNVVNITAIDKNDQENHLEFLLTYSTTKLE
jgi:hypothetical protein